MYIYEEEGEEEEDTAWGGADARAARYLEKKTRRFRVESAIFLFTRRVLAFFRVNPARSFNQPDFFFGALGLINRRVILG